MIFCSCMTWYKSLSVRYSAFWLKIRHPSSIEGVQAYVFILSNNLDTLKNVRFRSISGSYRLTWKKCRISPRPRAVPLNPKLGLLSRTFQAARPLQEDRAWFQAFECCCYSAFDPSAYRQLSIWPTVGIGCNISNAHDTDSCTILAVRLSDLCA